MLYEGKIWLGTGEHPVCLLPQMANRHGLIAGATGTGKTVSLKVLAEGFSDMGVPVFLADIKGDLAGMVQPGTHSDNIANRLTQREIKDLRILSKLCIMLGLSKKVIHESGWIEGTIVNAGKHISSNLRSARMAKYVTHLRQSLKAK